MRAGFIKGSEQFVIRNEVAIREEVFGKRARVNFTMSFGVTHDDPNCTSTIPLIEALHKRSVPGSSLGSGSRYFVEDVYIEHRLVRGKNVLESFNERSRGRFRVWVKEVTSFSRDFQGRVVKSRKCIEHRRHKIIREIR